ncbi:dethiobiotin synthetase [Herbaspirillum sp. Sphag1AN]|uniref:dethiobiotin synthase n=1 Tax=unclassified Herbaspirillum TaxID=2624150 RepID=UPI00161A9402|nr:MULTISPECIES: dethiobiotin synthase [unclassified Herbaspirillum]MBB3212272.1 dethiobiotin synthetase [Herbaspirillum sp. Sphag1AN]MBB3245630.1 dethiobiotin synthetase [Herbaspirillum sp. Sphag64]
MRTAKAYFVAGTDTGVGKTLVSAALVHGLAAEGLRVVGMKPVASGAQWQGNADGDWHNEDVDALLAVNNVALPAHSINPYLFQEPTAPHIAAIKEGQSISLETIVDAFQNVSTQAECVIVEGVGGFLVPLNTDADTGDLASLLALPVILVVGIRLGCINHALLTLEAIKARGLSVAGWVANIIDPDILNLGHNINSLRARITAPLLGCIPFLSAQASAQLAAGHLDLTLLAN